MIKREFIQFNNIRSPTFMIRMATLTFLMTNRRLTPVKTSAIMDVSPNVLVAAQTQYRLLSAMKFVVTFGTLVIKLSMSLDEGAWTHQGLNARSPARNWYTH